MAKAPGTKNKTPAELKHDAEILLLKAKLKIAEEKKKVADAAKKMAIKKAADAAVKNKK